MKLTVTFTTACHHGSGVGLPVLIDNMLLRDATGIPYLAGSAIKGKLLHAARRAAEVLEEPVCRTPLNRAHCKPALPGSACILCRIFGSPFLQGKGIFADAYPPADDIELLGKLVTASAGVRASTAIDRHSRTVVPRHLFTTETLPPLFEFECHIEGLSADEERFLEQSARLVEFFGAGSSRGLGFCSMRKASL